MSLRFLRTLTVIARKGTFAAAAERLGLTQAAVSLQIKRLEQEMDAELFDRGGRSPRLNASGRLVLERAEEILSLYDGLKGELNPREEVRGVLNLGAVHTVLTGPLPPALARLQGRYEGLQVKLFCDLSAELAARVEEGELDAALITEPLHQVPSQYEWSGYDVEPFYVVAPKGTEATDDEALFARFPFVRFARSAWAGAMIEGQLMARGIRPRDVMEFDSLEAALCLVGQGLGIAVVPLNERRLAEAAEQFTLVPFGEPQLKRRVGLYRKRRHPRRVLTELVLEELSREVDSLK